MKKLFLPVALFAMMSTLLGSCNNTGTNSGAQNDSIDSIDSVAADSDSLLLGKEQAVVGKVLDGAMNSIVILTDKGDTLCYSYHDLPQEKRAGWKIDDTVTVKFVKVKLDGEVQDSVTGLYLGGK